MGLKFIGGWILLERELIGILEGNMALEDKKIIGKVGRDCYSC